jgi:hypothetical protein
MGWILISLPHALQYPVPSASVSLLTHHLQFRPLGYCFNTGNIWNHIWEATGLKMMIIWEQQWNGHWKNETQTSVNKGYRNSFHGFINVSISMGITQKNSLRYIICLVKSLPDYPLYRVLNLSSSTSTTVVLLIASKHRHWMSITTSTLYEYVKKSTIQYQKSTRLRTPALYDKTPLYKAFYNKLQKRAHKYITDQSLTWIDYLL